MRTPPIRLLYLRITMRVSHGMEYEDVLSSHFGPAWAWQMTGAWPPAMDLHCKWRLGLNERSTSEKELSSRSRPSLSVSPLVLNRPADDQQKSAGRGGGGGGHCPLARARVCFKKTK